MGDSNQGNDKSKEKYKTWTTEETNELLKLTVDVANRDWRDKNGLLNKIKVEINILPTLIEKLGCQITYSQYLSRLKFFKQRFNNYCNLLRSSSRFGWDLVTKKFTALDEVCEDCFKVIIFFLFKFIFII